jgi:hypothetical protein
LGRIRLPWFALGAAILNVGLDEPNDDFCPAGDSHAAGLFICEYCNELIGAAGFTFCGFLVARCIGTRIATGG